MTSIFRDYNIPLDCIILKIIHKIFLLFCRTVDDRNTRLVLLVFSTWTIDYGWIQPGYILRRYRKKNYRLLRPSYHILTFIGYVESIQFVTSTTSTVFDQQTLKGLSVGAAGLVHQNIRDRRSTVEIIRHRKDRR